MIVFDLLCLDSGETFEVAVSLEAVENGRVALTRP